MLGSNLIWNIASWLSGPEIIVELNAISLPELDQLGNPKQLGGILFPLAEVEALREVGFAALPTNRIMLRVGPEDQGISAAIELVESLGYEVDLLAMQVEEPAKWEAFAERVYLHFNHLETSRSFVQTPSWTPKGIWLGPEAEEEFGLLHYEAIDDWIETINDHWEEE